jgi:hypothetical protein
MKKHPIKVGTSNFRKLVSSDGLTADLNRLFVDKTLFIKDFLDHSNDVVLITRPRRWGKSSALSMLQHFFSREIGGLPTVGLFEQLKINKYLNDPNYKKYQGVHPVILVNFKDIGGDDFLVIENNIKDLISVLYKKYGYILQALSCMDPKFNYETESLYKADIAQFERIINKQQDLSETESSLKFLSKLLCIYHGKKVFILIDEYDNAINYLFDKPKALKKLTNFFSKLFGSCLKENEDYLEKGLITGILRVAKANIFSGLNNPIEETILDYKFSEHYGFTETEVNELLDKAGIINKKEIKNWYNGYVIGNNFIYNPWSIMQCIAHNGDLEPYWVNSANPKMIKDLLINKSSREDKQKIRDLIKYKEASLPEELEKYVSFDDLNSQPQMLWSLLIHTGYLTLVKSSDKYHVRLPNQEITLLIKKYVNSWFISQPFLSKIANSLLIGDFAKFEEALKEIFEDPAYSARIFSGGGRAANVLAVEKAKEFVYQFLIMTELKCINLVGNSEYEVFAEIEDVSIGKTRPDLLVVNHKQKLCIVGEIKVSFRENEDLKKLARDIALAQIDRNQYGKKYQEQGYQILKLGIAFKGDNFELAY